MDSTKKLKLKKYLPFVETVLKKSDDERSAKILNKLLELIRNEESLSEQKINKLAKVLKEKYFSFKQKIKLQNAKSSENNEVRLNTSENPEAKKSPSTSQSKTSMTTFLSSFRIPKKSRTEEVDGSMSNNLMESNNSSPGSFNSRAKSLTSTPVDDITEHPSTDVSQILQLKNLAEVFMASKEIETSRHDVTLPNRGKLQVVNRMKLKVGRSEKKRGEKNNTKSKEKVIDLSIQEGFSIEKVQEVDAVYDDPEKSPTTAENPRQQEKLNFIPVVNRKKLKRSRKGIDELSILHRDHFNSHHSKDIQFASTVRASKLKSQEKTKQILRDNSESAEDSESLKKKKITKINTEVIKSETYKPEIRSDEFWMKKFSVKPCTVDLVRLEQENKIKTEQNQGQSELYLLQYVFCCKHCKFTASQKKFLGHLQQNHLDIKWTRNCNICKDISTGGDTLFDEFNHYLGHLEQLKPAATKEECKLVISEVRSLFKK